METKTIRSGLIVSRPVAKQQFFVPAASPVTAHSSKARGREPLPLLLLGGCALPWDDDDWTESRQASKDVYLSSNGEGEGEE